MDSALAALDKVKVGRLLSWNRKANPIANIILRRSAGFSSTWSRTENHSLAERGTLPRFLAQWNECNMTVNKQRPWH